MNSRNQRWKKTSCSSYTGKNPNNKKYAFKEDKGTRNSKQRMLIGFNDL